MPAEPLASAWAKGLAVNLLNPKIIMFFVTFLPQFVIASDPNATAKLIFLGVVFVVIATPISAAMVASAAGLARFLKQTPRAMRVIDWLFAGIFGAFAVRLLLTQRH